MNGLLASQVLVAALGAGWTVIFYFVKRTLRSIDTRLEENSRSAEVLAGNLKAAAEGRDERLRGALGRLARAASRNFALLKNDIARNGEALRKEAARAVSAQCGDCRKQYVTRQEFGAFTANMNHKIDSIYEFLKQEERTQKR